MPFTAVHLNDDFWAPRIEINRTASIPSAFEQCELTGRVKLFERAAAVLRGEPNVDKRPPGYPFDETDLYKVIEGASYSLSVTPDPKLDAYVDGLIAKIAAAQEPDGYIYTTRTIDPKNPHRWAGPERWVFERDDSHELYDLGHLFEAAVAHHLATGKRTLLDVAIKAADLLVATFGPGKRTIWPGHQITEMALVKLYRVTGKEAYLDLAKFLLDERGPGPYPEGERANPRGLNYNQAQLKVIEQSEPVGHAVRAVYMYSGMADVAAVTGDQAMRAAGKRIWDYLVTSKLYLTGGIGASGSGEAFGQPYELPNMTAYNETCASVGMDFWNHRLFLLEGDAKYIDVMERTLFNGLLSGVSLDGKTFFYPNPLESNGQHARQEWFGVACCPGNITRFMPSVPGYLYATQGRFGLRQPVRERHGEHRSARRRDHDRSGHALSVGWRGEDDGQAAAGATFRDQRPHSGMGAHGAGAERPLSLHRQRRRRRQRSRVNGDLIPGSLSATTIGSNKGYVTIDRTWTPGDTIDAQPADAGSPHRLERSGDRQSQSRRAAARPDRLCRRVARQSERQGPQHRAARSQCADDGVPRRPAERRAGDQGARDRPGLRREGRTDPRPISRSWRSRMRRGRIAAAARWRCGWRASMRPRGRRPSRPSSPPRRSPRRSCRTAATRTPATSSTARSRRIHRTRPPTSTGGRCRAASWSGSS